MAPANHASGGSFQDHSDVNNGTNGYTNGHSNGNTNEYSGTALEASNGTVTTSRNGMSDMNGTDGHSMALPEPSKTAPGVDTIRGYDHIRWYVGNAKQAASYYITRMNFQQVAYEGPETGSRYWASYVITNGTARFVLTSPIPPPSMLKDDPNSAAVFEVQEIYDHIAAHGDGVKDVAFEVDDVQSLYRGAVERGAIGVKKPHVMQDDNGMVEMATIKTFGDTTHTFVNRSQYKGVFLPGFREVTTRDPVNDYLPEIKFELIDHFVGNQDWNGLETAAKL